VFVFCSGAERQVRLGGSFPIESTPQRYWTAMWCYGVRGEAVKRREKRTDWGRTDVGGQNKDTLGRSQVCQTKERECLTWSRTTPLYQTIDEREQGAIKEPRIWGVFRSARGMHMILVAEFWRIRKCEGRS